MHKCMYVSLRLRTFSFENIGFECALKVLLLTALIAYILQRSDFLQFRVFNPSPSNNSMIQYEALQESYKQVDKCLMVRYY